MVKNVFSGGERGSAQAQRPAPARHQPGQIVARLLAEHGLVAGDEGGGAHQAHMLGQLEGHLDVAGHRLGLHPAAIAQLAAIMHQVAPDVQIVAATQSPTLANQFGWQDFIVADRRAGASSFRRLSETEVVPWMEDFAMGEIWEKNLIGGRP